MFETAEETGIAGAMLRRLKNIMAARSGSLAEIPQDSRAPLKKYCPHRPWPKQSMFLKLDCLEAFFGGAAGGGKSDVLLMDALQHVHIPGYSALILRSNYTKLWKAGAIMSRAHAWLHNTDAKWNEQKHRFTFPSGATLEFGFIDNPRDWMNFLGTEYQFIGWDELTEFALVKGDENNPYQCMFRSLRKAEGIDVPLKVRATSNPGGRGHACVKEMFITDEARLAVKDGKHDKVFDAPGGRKFVPSLVADNPTINPAEYVQQLMHLPPVTRARQMEGDWDAAENLQIPEAWLLPYTLKGQLLCANEKPGPNGEPGQPLPPIDERYCQRFATIDTAGTSRDKAEESKGKPPSWSVCLIWDWDRHGKLFLRKIYRERVGWNELKLRVPEFLKLHKCPKAHVENAHVGQPLADELKAVGIQVELVGPVLPGMAEGYRGAKLERAIASGLLTMLEAGRVFFPHDDPKWPDYLMELTSWTGNPAETSDQIDASSYAAWVVKQGSGGWGGVVNVSRNPMRGH